ncbi:hypothetical protein HOLDEFILI_01112 [Holdemania filiformis DSM 12042]|uniref:Uncharacterized protein n=1 Tax=Holdemania filiformis DSM 12042 TaxID=545696 RepID=B9Y5N0_9FIRM|nr:hypothetical protein HOLDEFILI_01112 [Holdemania filiformis DSM 12042]
MVQSWESFFAINSDGYPQTLFLKKESGRTIRNLFLRLEFRL